MYYPSPIVKRGLTGETTVTDPAMATSRSAVLVGPLLQFRHFGIPLANHWTTITNGAAFGLDYFTRTAVAKSNILVNKDTETKYLYQDLDAAGGRLNGANRYVVSFPKGAVPPVKGFWSLTMYNEHHLFEPNPIKRTGGYQEQGSADRTRWISDDLRSGRPAERLHPACQLVACSEGRLLAVHPCILARAGNHKRAMAATGGAATDLTRFNDRPWLSFNYLRTI